MEQAMRNVVLSKVKESILEIEPSAELILYGSRAREDFREYSDCDFLVLVDGLVDTARTDRIRRVLFDIELDINQVISSIIRSRQEWNSPRYSVSPLHKNVEREGIHI
jgi:predicted nucleotidyltransferase